MLRMAMDMIHRHPLLKNRREISKLSKKYHVPLASNPLNDVTHTVLSKKDL